MSKKTTAPATTPAAPAPARDIATLLATPELEQIAPWETFKTIKDATFQAALVAPPPQIGRASCRERG